MRKEKLMNNIDFEQDQRADLDGANDANKLYTYDNRFVQSLA